MSDASPRAGMLERLARESFDLAIIGGGINGAAIAREAALRGLRVALVDAGDFAGATSSASSKLIHGGLRYLPQLQFRLVYRALRERERLRHMTAPHLVRPIRFVMPFFRGRSPGRFNLIAGLMLYDLMAWTPRAEDHRWLSNHRLREIEPRLAGDGMIGGATYFDAWGDDARLTIENIIDAAHHGAAVANYVSAQSLACYASGRWAINLRDRESGRELGLRADRLVNASGPWCDQIRQLDDPDAVPIARLTKGVHLIIAAERLPICNSLVLIDGRGRIVFLMRHDSRVLVGTTDTDFDQDPARVAVEGPDIDYLIGVIAQALPEFRLKFEDIEYAFAGLRVLPRVARLSPSSVPRDEIVSESRTGLLTVAGGKLTTHRAIAELVVNRIIGKSNPSPTRTLPLPGARSSESGEAPLESLPLKIKESLRERYGTRAALVVQVAEENRELLAPIIAEASTIAAEVVFTTRYEFARTVEDFLIRRTSLAWRSPGPARDTIAPVARLMGRELGWDQAREQAEIAHAEAKLQVGSAITNKNGHASS